MKRLVSACVAAGCLAVVFVAVAEASSMEALCAIYTTDDVQWWFYLCYLYPRPS